MLSKYYAARRRMESLAKEVEDLQKKLKKAAARRESIATKCAARLEQLRQLMRKEAEEIRKSAKRRCPIDLDKNLDSAIAAAGQD